MELKAFSIYDAKTKVFSLPQYQVTLGSILRSFGDLVNDGQSMVSKHPEDYQLYEVGTWDDSNASFTPKSPLNLVATATEYKQSALKTDATKIQEAI